MTAVVIVTVEPLGERGEWWGDTHKYLKHRDSCLGLPRVLASVFLKRLESHRKHQEHGRRLMNGTAATCQLLFWV